MGLLEELGDKVDFWAWWEGKLQAKRVLNVLVELRTEENKEVVSCCIAGIVVVVVVVVLCSRHGEKPEL